MHFTPTTFVVGDFLTSDAGFERAAPVRTMVELTRVVFHTTMITKIVKRLNITQEREVV